MFPKSVARVFIFLILVAAVYFLVIQPRGRSRRAPLGPPFERRGRDFSGEMRPDRHRERERDTNPSSSGPETACESEYFSQWREPADAECEVRSENGYPVPDPRCTPGGVNPSVTEDVLRDPSWRTREVRNCAESEAQKHIAYRWYDIAKPRINSNENQVCELDHLVPLELGGADGMGNIWPQCGPDAVALNERYFKRKDLVENYLAEAVKKGQMPLAQAQRGIAANWTQYLDAATRWCAEQKRC